MAYGLRIINDASDLLIDSEFVNPTFVQKMEFSTTPTYTEASDGRQHPGFIRRNYSTGYVAKGTGTYIVLWALPDSIASGPEKDVWYQFTTSEATNNLSFDCSVYANSQGSPIAYSLPTAYVFTIDAAGVNLMSSTGPALRMYNSSSVKTFDSNFLQLLPTYVSNNYSIPQGEQYTPLYMALTMVNAIFLLPKTALMFAGDIGGGFSSYKVFDVVYRRRGQYLDTRTMSTSYQEEDSTIGSPLIIFPAGTFDNLTVIAANGDFYQASGAGTQPGSNPTYTLTRSAASVNEGSAFTITLTVTNATVLNGTSIGYNVTGLQGSSDYTASATSFIVNNNTSSVTFTVLNDTFTEGTETFLLELTTSPYPTIAVTINDTSITPPLIPTYSISPQTGAVNEGSSITFTVTTTNVANGTTLYWVYNGGSSDPVSDFNAYNGSFTISGNSGTFSVSPKADTLTEGSETFAVGVRTGSITGMEVATTGTITINDTSISVPAYSFTSQQNVTEGQTGNSIANFTFTNVVNKTVTFAIVAPSSGNAATSGTDVTINITSMNINGSSFREVSYYPAADQITEGTEYFRITATIDGLVVATTSNILISDTSTYPAAGTLLSQSCAAYGVYPYTLNKVYADGNGGTYTEGTFLSPTCGYSAPAYSWATSPLSVNEGATSSLNFNYTNAPPNTAFTFNFQPPAVGTSANVPADGSLNTSSFTTGAATSSGSVSVSYSIVADSLTEGTESFRIQAIVDGTTPYNSGNITINDTSLTPAAATYTLTAAAASVNEGSSVTFTAGGTNITNGTYYWTITNSGDFGTTSGSFTITSNSGSFSVSPTADSTTEGAETFTASIRSGSTSGTILATSGSVTINDTSTTPAATYTLTAEAASVNEGSSVTFTAGGTNITNGTYYWTITNSGDFGTSSGSFTITSNSGSFSVSPTADSTTEGAETFTASIRSGSTSGTILATSGSVTINDTSTTPVATTPIWRFHRTVGTITWTVPAGRTSIIVIVIAGGAGGRSQTGGGGGGGSGGVQYIDPVSVAPGQVLTLTVGAGGGSNTNGSPSSITGTGVNIVAGGGTTGIASTSSNGGNMGSGNFGGGVGGTGAPNAGGGGGGVGGVAGEQANGYSATAGIAGDGGNSFPLFYDIAPGPFNVCGGGGGAALNEAGQGGFASGGQGAGPGGTNTNNGGAAVDHGGGGGGARQGGTGGAGFRGMIAWYG